MKSKHYIFSYILFVLLFFVGSKAYAEVGYIKYIDIKLTRPRIEENVINLQSEKGFSIYNIEDKLNPIFPIELNKIKVILDENKDILLLDSLEDVIFKIPKDNNFILQSNKIEESTILIENSRYRGYLRFKVENEEIILINHIDMEEYLYGVVPAEMAYNFPREALKAQAVAARTYATRNMDKYLSEGFNLCDTTKSQVYVGYDKENLLTNLAVDETKGILAYYDGEPINAQYHSTSSGVTENSFDVWGGNLDYLTSVKDDFSLGSPHSNWEIKMDLNDLNKKLISNGINIGSLKGIDIIENSTSGSVKKIKLIGAYGEEIISGSQFRTIIGNTTLKSTWFNIAGENGLSMNREVYIIGKDGVKVSKRISEISVLEVGARKPVSRSGASRVINKYSMIEDLLKEQSISTILIEGKGYGHGVGMSQHGAKNMAELGYNFKDILKHYYTGIDVL